MTPPRIADPQGLLAGVSAELAAILAAAAAAMPAGWRLDIVAGGPPGGGLALDVRLVDARGRAVPPFCRAEHGPVYEAYRRLADAAYAAQRRLYPELAPGLAWGGKLTTADGRWHIGRFDLAGLRGRGRYRPPPLAFRKPD